MEILYSNLLAFDRYDLIMIAIGCLLIYLAVAKEMEPSLLLPMGFGTILVNIPFSDALVGPIQELYNAGIANELFPLLLFIGIGAMIDFGPLLSNPKLMLFGAAAQFGIFFTLCMNKKQTPVGVCFLFVCRNNYVPTIPHRHQTAVNV